MVQDEKASRLPGWAPNLLLVVTGLVFSFVLIQGLIAFFPQVLPRQLRPNPYDQRTQRPDDVEITYHVGDGDLFIAQPGSVAPPANPTEVLTHYEVNFDGDGFRRPLVEAQSYPIITIGDSFTDDLHVPLPWPDVLADELATPVRNLGFQGYGPQDYARVAQLYGSQQPHDWVVVGYFEGNDLVTAIVDEENPLTLPAVAREAIEAALGDKGTPDYGEGPWKYPLDMQLGNRTEPLAIFEFYLWFLNGELSTFEQSAEVVALGDLLAEIDAQTDDACVLLAYFPAKSHIYLPYVNNLDGRAAILSSALEVTLDADNRLEAVPVTMPFETLLERLDNQSMAVENLVQDKGIHFVNLATPFKQAAARGQMLYYTYDTHPNEQGHRLAGETIANYIEGHSACISSP